MSTATKDEAGWKVPITIAASGEKTIKFETKNRFLDDDARVVITTPAASAPTLSATNNTGSLSMGTASSGVYSPTATITGNAVISTAGWIASGNHSVSATNVVVGKVNQSTMANGNTAVASGDTITPTDSNQTITISEGYNAARTLIVGSTSTGAAGEITSGSATIDTLTYAYDSTNEYFLVSGKADVSAPTVNTAGYISSSAGTKNANTEGAQVDTTVAKIAIAAAVSGTTTAQKPTLSKQAISITGVEDAANGSASTTSPSSGVYVAVQSGASTGTLIATPSVSSDGYGTTTNYDATTATATVGAAASDTHYIPIKVGTITSGTATISSVSAAYNSTSGKYDITGSANVSAPTVGTAGYVSSTNGTKNAKSGGATVSATLNKIGIQANLSGTGTKKPSIAKAAATNIDAAGTATTTQPSSGYYIAVASAANTGTVQATASVTSAGYGTTTTDTYTTTPSSSLTIGAAASDTTYIPLTQATFENSATSGVEYTDISSTGPVLISGSYLFINEGYTPATKISLARLVPDASGTNAPAAYILENYTAFDNDGTLIIGTMQTYGGSYTVV